ncbi:MAG: hypothetical protein ACREMJ_03330 [Gemmatimonadales bacterium]
MNELNFARFEAQLDAKLEKQKAEIIKWMFAFWAPTALGVIATGIGVVSLLLRR